MIIFENRSTLPQAKQLEEKLRCLKCGIVFFFFLFSDK